MKYAETDTTIIFEKPFFQSMMQDVIDRTTKVAVETTVKEMSKEVELNTSQIAKLLNVSEPTVIKYMHKGYKKIGVLKHIKHNRKYTANKYDVLQFKNKF